MPSGVPPEVAAIRAEIRRFLDTPDVSGRKIGNAKYGAYVFYDYDGEPIYVGQTVEMVRSRIGRHLTNQRTDAVAMNVLDPFEVAEIEVWPLYAEDAKGDIGKILNGIEYTVFQKVLRASKLGAVLNEKDIPTDTPGEIASVVSRSDHSSRALSTPQASRHAHRPASIDNREPCARDQRAKCVEGTAPDIANSGATPRTTGG